MAFPPPAGRIDYLAKRRPIVWLSNAGWFDRLAAVNESVSVVGGAAMIADIVVSK